MRARDFTQGVTNFVRNLGRDRDAPIVMMTNPANRGARAASDQRISIGDFPLKTVAVAELQPWEPMIKMQDLPSQRTVASLIQTLRQGGSIPPLLVTPVRGGYRIIDGHHRYAALQRAGIDRAAVRVVDPRLIRYSDEVLEALRTTVRRYGKHSIQEDRTATVELDGGERRQVRYVPGRGDWIDWIIAYYWRQGRRVLKVDDHDIDWDDDPAVITQAVAEGRVKESNAQRNQTQDLLSQIPNLIWQPVNRDVWNTIQDEGLDEEQDAPNRTDWLMAFLSISQRDAQALQALDDDAIEKFNRFDIQLKSRYPGLTDLIDYDNGTVTIVKTSQPSIREGRVSDIDIDLQDQQWEAVVGFVQDGVRRGRDADRMSIDLYRWAGGEQFDVDEELERRGFRSVTDLADHIREHGGRYVPPQFDLSGAASLRDIEQLERRRDDDVQENFADGKVKGRSRPGRVKRAGASCQGSVTDLRARAKKYGGERGKMYHWCANMKSGKQKK